MARRNTRADSEAPEDEDTAAEVSPEGDETEGEARGKRDKTNVVYNTVRVTSSRSQHPDRNPMAKGFFSNYPEAEEGGGLAVSAVVHRRSDGEVDVKRRKANTGNELVVMVLGQFEPGFPAYRPFTQEERDAIEDLLTELKDRGELAEDAPVYFEYGVQNEGWQQRAPEPRAADDGDTEELAPAGEAPAASQP